MDAWLLPALAGTAWEAWCWLVTHQDWEHGSYQVTNILTSECET